MQMPHYPAEGVTNAAKLQARLWSTTYLEVTTLRQCAYNCVENAVCSPSSGGLQAPNVDQPRR